MILQEIITIGAHQVKHTYSSINKQIQQVETGIIYDEAFDTLKNDYHYIEIDQDVCVTEVPHPQYEPNL